MPRGAAGGIVTCWGGFFNRWKISLNIGGGGEIGEMQLSEREVRGLSESQITRISRISRKGREGGRYCLNRRLHGLRG